MIRSLLSWLRGGGPLVEAEGDDERVAACFHPYRKATGDRFRGRCELLDPLVRRLKEPNGPQVCIFGPAGSGKTSLALRAVELAASSVKAGVEPIYFMVSRGSTKAQFLGQLHRVLLGREPGKVMRHVGGSIGLGPAIAEVGGGVEFEEALDTQAIARLIVERNQPLIVDDIENVLCDEAEIEPAVLADLMKKVHDLCPEGGVARLIVVGAVQDIRPLFLDVPGSEERTNQTEVPLLTTREQRDISRAGFRSLGIGSDERSLARIHHHSCGLPRVLHAICREVATLALAAVDVSTRGRRIMPYVQDGIGRMWGENLVSRGLDESENRLVRAAAKLRLEPAELRQFAVAASLIPAPSFTVSGVSAFMKEIGANCMRPDRCAEAMHVEGLIDVAVKDREGAVRFSFTSYELRLGFRFMVSRAGLKGVWESRWFEKEHRGLAGSAA